MRELTPDALGQLLAVFAVLLISFAIDFHLSKKSERRHPRVTLLFGIVALIGELMTVLALVLTWVALWSPAAWEAIDDMLVFIPGSIAFGCAVILTIDKLLSRLARLSQDTRSDASTRRS